MIRPENTGLTYAGAGVDIDAGNEVVRRIGDHVKSTHTRSVLSGSHGGFAGMFRLGELGGEDPILVGATDGVGTKLKVAFLAEQYDTVGIDLVAMCVNDLIVGGARPLFFLDYIGTGVVEPEALERVVAGVARGCRESGCALLGGETAEMPGFYKKGELDLAGFAVGVVEKKKLIDGRKVKEGDVAIGLPSAGVHSNGFSLIRKALLEGKGKRALKAHATELGRPLGEELLEPTRLYVSTVMALLDSYEGTSPVRAMCHVTGGGLVENLPRVIPDGLGIALDRSTWSVPKIFGLIQREGGIAPKEMDRVFNQGIGYVMVVPGRKAKSVVERLQELGDDARVIGEVTGKRGVRYRGRHPRHED